MISYDGIGKGDPNYILKFKINHTSTTHRLRCNQVLPSIGNDVIGSYSLGGAASDFLLRNWKEQPRLYTHVALKFCVYLEPFTSYSTSYNWLGFQHISVYFSI